MKEVRVQDAEGLVLAHDITEIIAGKSKGPAFKKGHVVTKEDIPHLLNIGKEHLYVFEMDAHMLHENDAAFILRDLCKGAHLTATDASEGKVELFAETDGLLKIDRKRLYAINSLGEMMVASRHGNTEVKKGDKIAGLRVIPLVIEKEKMERARTVAAGEGAIFNILPFTHKKIGIVTTGSEILNGRIEDTFTPALVKKLSVFDTEVTGQEKTGDDRERIAEAIRDFVNKGADIVLCSGGMSVDPDDRTPAAIRDAAPDVITYGAPVLPGAMFMLAYTTQGVPVMGLPGCVMYAKRTIFDLVLPRILAGERMCAEDFYDYGEGGLCLNCDICTYPNCGFGK